MKFILAGAAFAAACLGAASPCRAQYVVATHELEPPRVELSPMVGYVLSDGVDVPGGSVDVRSSPMVGGAVDIGDWYGAYLELAYSQQFTGIDFQPYDAAVQSLYRMSLHHFQIGGEFDFLPGSVRPFLGFTLGAALLAPHTQVPDELWFETSLEGGAKVMFSRDLGLRAQVQVTSVFMDSSSQIFCGNGCYVPWWGDGIGTTQVGFAVGPVFGF